MSDEYKPSHFVIVIVVIAVCAAICFCATQIRSCAEADLQHIRELQNRKEKP